MRNAAPRAATPAHTRDGTRSSCGASVTDAVSSRSQRGMIASAPSSMRLAFITNLYPPYIVGGNEMLCDEVITALRARGHDVSLICGRGRDLPKHPDVHGVLPLDLDRKDET